MNESPYYQGDIIGVYKVQNQGHLGIYLSRHSASVICLQSPQNVLEPTASFEVNLEPQQIEDGSGFNELITQIAQQCSQKQLEFSTVAVALDCSLYMQHDIRSSFTDPRQINTTIRFDAEEALATDISDLALTYKIKSTDENGTKLSIFTIEKSTLAEIIKALASNNLDPSVIEPDVNCIWTYIAKNNKFEVETLISVLSKSNVYLLGPIGPEHNEPLIQRTFLIGANTDRSRILLQNTPLTIAQYGAEIPQQLEIYDTENSIEPVVLSQDLGMAAKILDIKIPQEYSDAVTYSACVGAIIASDANKTSLNFRNDFMPYLGKKKRLENTLKIISISASVILIALGLSLQLKMIKKSRPLKELQGKFSQDYEAVMLQRNMPSKSSEAIRKLKSELRRIQNLKKGLDTDGDKSASGKLTSLLSVFNNVAQEINLNIEKITITDKNVTLKGDTANQSGTLKLLKEIKNKMNVESNRLGSTAGRSTFTITIGPKR